MFEVGDRVVYPMHGAGVIEKIESKQVLGEIRDYYVLNVSSGAINIMIPTDNCERIGMRHIISQSEVDEVFALLRADSTAMESNWNRRYRENTEKLKTGDILEVAEVVRNLWRNDKVKKLSAGEKNMLNNAKQILISELALVQDCPASVLLDRVEELISEKI